MKGQQTLQVNSFGEIESRWRAIPKNLKRKYLSKPTATVDGPRPPELKVVSMPWGVTRTVAVDEQTMEIIKEGEPLKRMKSLTLQDTLKLYL